MADRPGAVLDASAVIALLWEEAGADAVEDLLGAAVVSAVNWAEVLQRYTALGLDTAGRRDSVEALGIAIDDFSGDDARGCGKHVGIDAFGRPVARRQGVPVSRATTWPSRAHGRSGLGDR